jgi:hypothetical protein
VGAARAECALAPLTHGAADWHPVRLLLRVEVVARPFVLLIKRKGAGLGGLRRSFADSDSESAKENRKSASNAFKQKPSF